jgi:hypothetical protein
VLEKSAARLPEHPIVLYHFGAAHLAAGHDAQGRQLLEKALSVSGDFPGAADARRLLEGRRKTPRAR